MRTVLIGVPGLLTDIVHQTVDGLVVVGAFEEHKELAEAVAETDASFLIMRMRLGWDQELVACLERYPRLRALAIERNERAGVVCELRPRTSRLPGLKLAALVEAIEERPPWRFQEAQ